MQNIHAAFASHSDAAKAINRLTDLHFAAGQFSVIGEDCDAFRDATASLRSLRVPRLIFQLGLAGAVAGCAAGFLGLPNIPARETMFLLMVPISAAFVGTAVGLMSGMFIGGILKLDEIPASEAEVRLGSPTAGDLAVSVAVESDAQAQVVQQVFISCGAKSVMLDVEPDYPAQESSLTETPLVVLARTA